MSARVAVLMAGLGVWLGIQDRVDGTRLALIPVVSMPLAYLGMRSLVKMGNQPIFETRLKRNLASSLVVGAPLGVAYAVGPGSTSPGAAVALLVVGGAALFLVVTSSNSPRRGRGWLMRLNARRLGATLCPHCGMARRGDRCRYCGWDSLDL